MQGIFTTEIPENWQVIWQEHHFPSLKSFLCQNNPFSYYFGAFAFMTIAFFPGISRWHHIEKIPCQIFVIDQWYNTKGAIIYYWEGGAVCLWGGTRIFWGSQRGGTNFFSGSKGGTRIFWGSKRGGPKFFLKFSLRLQHNSFLDTLFKKCSRLPRNLFLYHTSWHITCSHIITFSLNPNDIGTL